MPHWIVNDHTWLYLSLVVAPVLFIIAVPHVPGTEKYVLYHLSGFFVVVAAALLAGDHYRTPLGKTEAILFVVGSALALRIFLPSFVADLRRDHAEQAPAEALHKNLNTR